MRNMTLRDQKFLKSDLQFSLLVNFQISLDCSSRIIINYSFVPNPVVLL